MTTPRRWIIGRGLLGAAIANSRPDDAFHVPVDWTSPSRSLHDLTNGLDRFLDAAPGAWEIYWSAGRGVTSTPRETVMAEADVFEGFLRVLAERGGAPSGVIFLGSSVGGAYAGSSTPPFTETSEVAPLSAYGEAKLRMEAALSTMVQASGNRAFIARITNLYGPGQDLAKGQGLISVIVEGYVTGRPVTVYVSLDTLRDYIYVDDCAKIISSAVERTRSMPSGTTVTKIVGSMTALSIGAIIGEMSRLRRKPVPIVVGQGNGSGQALDLRVRSEVWTDLDGLAATTLPAGLGAVYRSQLQAHMRSRP